MPERMASMEHLFHEDFPAFLATLRVFKASGMDAGQCDALLARQGASRLVRLEARLAWEGPATPHALVTLLHRALDGDLAGAVAESCRRHTIHPLSVVARETLHPLAVGRTLGLPEYLTRSMPGRRKKGEGVGLWRPGAGSLRHPEPRDLVLKQLVLADQPELGALPPNLWVADAITLDRLPKLKRLEGALDRFKGSLRIRCCNALEDLPQELEIRALVLEGQDWESLPLARIRASTVGLHHMVRLRSLPGGFEVKHLKVSACPELVRLDPIPGLIPAPEPSPKDLRNGLPFLGYGLTLHRCLRLSTLPEGLKVPGSLTIQDCPSIESLPEDLEAWNLELKGLPSLGRLPDGWRVRGHLTLEALDGLQNLPSDLDIRGHLDLTRMSQPLAPSPGLRVGGQVFLHPSHLTPAWSGFRVAHKPIGLS